MPGDIQVGIWAQISNINKLQRILMKCIDNSCVTAFSSGLCAFPVSRMHKPDPGRIPPARKLCTCPGYSVNTVSCGGYRYTGRRGNPPGRTVRGHQGDQGAAATESLHLLYNGGKGRVLSQNILMKVTLLRRDGNPAVYG